MKPHSPKIVCGTDFSLNAGQAAEVAAALAARLKGRLTLVHVADETNALGSKPSDLNAFLRPIKVRLQKEAGRLRKMGAAVDDVLLHGKWAEQAMIEFVEAAPADLVVVSSVSKTSFDRWTIGSVSEGVAEHSSAPTLVVRSPGPLLEWLREKRPLKIFVAVDFSDSSDAALAWISQVSKLGPCAVTVAHVNWPLEDARLSAGKSISLTANSPAVRRRLERDLEKKVHAWLGTGNVTLHVEPNWGRPDAALVRAATEAGADLVVTGAHQRRGLGRVGHLSISRGVLSHSTMNVACVPASLALAHGVGFHPELRRILAATDFSTTGDRAIGWAYAALPAGGVVRLIHVIPPWAPASPLVTRYDPKQPTRAEHRRQVTEARRRLAGLMPADAAVRGIRTEVEVISDGDPSHAIRVEAQRFGPDILCLGRQRHGPMAEALLGSVARQVLTESGYPVLLVPPARP